ncbi:MAG: hypothetical protein JWR19_610 [Pedosphaera sp.]|nr:hypothetical protein [Pedosphaera sp.]
MTRPRCSGRRPARRPRASSLVHAVHVRPCPSVVKLHLRQPETPASSRRRHIASVPSASLHENLQLPHSELMSVHGVHHTRNANSWMSLVSLLSLSFFEEKSVNLLYLQPLAAFQPAYFQNSYFFLQSKTLPRLRALRALRGETPFPIPFPNQKSQIANQKSSRNLLHRHSRLPRVSLP